MWTMICYDVDGGKAKPYVRLIPPFLSDPGWGISLGRFFDTDADATENANYVNAYMERSMDCLCIEISELLDDASAKKVQEYFDQLKVDNV